MSNKILTLLLLGLTLQDCCIAAPSREVTYNSSSVVTPCRSDDECVMAGWEAPYQRCIRGGCRCGDDNPCTQRTVTDDWNSYAYFCGQCGVMGSACSSDRDCPSPYYNCYNDYCKCFEGYIFRGICRVDNIMSTASTSNIMLCFVLLLLLVVNKIVASRRVRNMIRRTARCCTNRGGGGGGNPHVGDDGVFHNPRSGEKSASYTISNSDFITSTDDPDLEWAIELSRQLQEESGRQRGNDSTSSSIRASIRSRASNITRSSLRSRASNTSRRNAITRTGGRNVATAQPSSANSETTDDQSQSISDTTLNATSIQIAFDNPAKEESHVIENDKSVSDVRSVQETNQKSSPETESFPLKTILNSSTNMTSSNGATTETSYVELGDQPKASSVPLRKVSSTSTSASVDSLSTDEPSRSRESSESNTTTRDSECTDHEQNTNRGNKVVVGKGKMIILVPRKRY